MNGISIRVESSDYIGRCNGEEVEPVGSIGGSPAIFYRQRGRGELVICQQGQCLVIGE